MWVPLSSPKPSECPTFPAAAYVDMGPPRDQKGGFILINMMLGRVLYLTLSRMNVLSVVGCRGYQL